MDHMELADYGQLRETVDFFRSRGRMFRRDSLAAGVGWSSPRVFSGGRRAPLYEELRAIRPRYALIHFGGNDIQGANLARYTHWMWRIVERLVERGVIPVLTTVMPRGDDPAKNELVPAFNAALRALARTWQIPLIDLHAALLPLPRWGLAGDGQHPNSFAIEGQTRACQFHEEGLQHGNNVRNLVSLMMLDRLRRYVALGQESEEPEAPRVLGAGDEATPFRWDTWPLLHRGVAQGEGSTAVRDYSFRLNERQSVTLWLAPRRDVRLQFELRAHRGGASSETIVSGSERFERELDAGEYTLRVSSPGRDGGEYVLIGDAVDPGDRAFIRHDNR
jgi:hypothetical protein